MKKVKLERQSDNPLDPWYKVFLSKPIRITIDPYEDREINYRDREGNNKTSNLRMLSGDIMWAHISEDFLVDSLQDEYINPFEASKIGDILYYDGTGRRERFKAIKNEETISGYTPPKGWFETWGRCVLMFQCCGIINA
jgi:hypothetical protein